MLIHPSSGACDLFVELCNGLYCSGTMRVGDTVWFGWGGVVSGCRLKPASGYRPTTGLRKRGSAVTWNGYPVIRAESPLAIDGVGAFEVLGGVNLVH
jgi:hypothetical protein